MGVTRGAQRNKKCLRAVLELGRSITSLGTPAWTLLTVLYVRMHVCMQTGVCTPKMKIGQLLQMSTELEETLASLTTTAVGLLSTQ